jgi:Helix-turn-helix domain
LALTDLRLTLPPEALNELAELVADKVTERQPAPAEPFLDTNAAAVHLSTKPQRIYELVHKGILDPDGRDGKRLLFRRESLDAYAANGK